MTKRIFKKSLAILLSVMLVLSAFGGVMSVFAEEITEEPTPVFDGGTVSDGFETALNKLHGIKAVEGVLDLTGANGLKYWSSKHDRAGFASDYAVAVEDADQGYAIGMLTPVDGKAYDGIETVDFTIPGAKVGDKYYLTYEFMVNPNLGDYIAEYNAANPDAPISTKDLTNICGKARPFQILFAEHTHSSEVTDHNVDGSNTTLDNLVSKSGVWGYSVTGALTVTSETPTFSVLIQSFIPTSKEETVAEDGTVTPAVEWREKLADILGDEPLMYFANLRVCTHDGANYVDARTNETLVLGQPVGGTAHGGVHVNLVSGGFIYVKDQGSTFRNSYFTPYATTFNNGDFSDGFKYWTIRFNHKETYVNHVRTTSVNDVFVLEDGGVKFTGAPDTDIGSYYGLVSMPMQLDLKAGDQILVTAKTKGKTSIAFWLQEIGGSASTRASGATGDTWVSKSSGALTIKNDNPVLIIESQIASSTSTNAAGAMIDDIQILKILDNGYYLDIATGETTYSNGNPIGGTYEDGINTGDAGAAFKVDLLDAPKNLTFTDGLKYWTSKYDAAGTASAYIDLKVDEETGDNMVGLKKGLGQYSGITSIAFKPAGATNVAIMYEYKIDSRLSNSIYASYGNKNPFSIDVVNIGNAAVKTASSHYFGNTYGKWACDITSTFAVEADSYYSIRIQQMVSATEMAAVLDGESPCYIKNIRLVELQANGLYRDISDGKLYYKTGEILGGTAEEGVSAGYVYNTLSYPGMHNSPNGTTHFGSTEGFMNADFSDGFKYWALKGDAYGRQSDDGSVTVSKLTDVFEVEDGVVSFKGLAKEADAYLGFQSTPFTLADVTKEGDVIYFAMDVKANMSQRIKVYSDNGSAVKDNVTSSDWTTVYTSGITVTDVNATYAVEVQSYRNNAEASYKNFQILKADKGGLENAPKVTLDGKLTANDVYGDANYDGKVDLVDLVRMKKYAASVAGDIVTPIFFAAADINGSDAIDADDTVAVINKILGIVA